MSDIDDKIKEIFSRVDVAANGQISTSYWSEADINLSAPDGMDYWEWVEQATNDALLASKALVEQNKALRAALEAIKQYQEVMAGGDEMILSKLTAYAIANKALEQAQ